MDNCLIIFKSGNHAILVRDELKKCRVNTRVEATPCSIAKDGCSYCIKTSEDKLIDVLKKIEMCKVPIRDVYKIVFRNGKKKYEKMEASK